MFEIQIASSKLCCCSVIKLCLTLCNPWTVAHWLLCPPLSPRVCSNSCPLSRWCYLTISFSATLFFCFQSFPPSGSFPMSRLFASGSQSIGSSASPSVLPMNIQHWSPLELTGWISLLSKGQSSPAPQFKSINSSNFWGQGCTIHNSREHRVHRTQCAPYQARIRTVQRPEC